MMRKGRLLHVMLGTLAFMFLLAVAGEGREVKGTTVSSMAKLSVSAVDPDGGAISAPVKVIKKVRTPKGMIFTGKFHMDLPYGKKYMIVFYEVKPGGGMAKAKAVARYASRDAENPWKTQFKVTDPPKNGEKDIDLGKVRIDKHAVTVPSSNPLDKVDTDGDGKPDFKDADDDDDGIPDDEDFDDDANEIDDDKEDMDFDDDGLPDCVDKDDDDDGIMDVKDMDDDNDGKMDRDEMDVDDDGIEDDKDVDDDNDGMKDGPDVDMDGDGIPDAKEKLR